MLHDLNPLIHDRHGAPDLLNEPLVVLNALFVLDFLVLAASEPLCVLPHLFGISVVVVDQHLDEDVGLDGSLVVLVLGEHHDGVLQLVDLPLLDFVVVEVVGGELADLVFDVVEEVLTGLVVTEGGFVVPFSEPVLGGLRRLGWRVWIVGELSSRDFLGFDGKFEAFEGV